MIEQFMVLNIHPAQGKGPCNVEINDGRKIAAWNNEHTQLQIGSSYSADIYSKVNGNYTNWAFSKTPNITPAGGVQQPAQQTPPAQQPPQQPAPQQAPGLSKDEVISRLAVAKSCIESGKTQADADSWMAWVYKKPQQSQQPETPPPPNPDGYGQSDSVPF